MTIAQFPELQIVVVEDDPSILWTIEEILKGTSCSYRSANSIAAARAIFEKLQRPALLLTDLEIGGEFGSELIERLVKSGSETQISGVILMSGNLISLHTPFSFENRLAELTIPFERLEKPFRAADLLGLFSRLNRKRESPASGRDTLATRWLFRGQPGRILHDARRNLDLGVEEVLLALQGIHGIVFSQEEYRLLEAADVRPEEIASPLWYALCQLFQIPTEALGFGYVPREQLIRVRTQCRNGEFPFLPSQTLIRRLEELDQQGDSPVISAPGKKNGNGDSH